MKKMLGVEDGIILKWILKKHDELGSE